METSLRFTFATQVYDRKFVDDAILPSIRPLFMASSIKTVHVLKLSLASLSSSSLLSLCRASSTSTASVPQPICAWKNDMYFWK